MNMAQPQTTGALKAEDHPDCETLEEHQIVLRNDLKDDRRIGIVVRATLEIMGVRPPAMVKVIMPSITCKVEVL